MSKYPIAVVCLLAFIAGGAAAVVFHRSPRGAGSAPEAVDRSAAVGRVEGGESGAAAVEVAEDAGAEQESSDAAGDAAGEPAGGGVSPAVRLRRRAATSVSAVDGARERRGHTRASAGRAPSGGRSVAGYTVGGLKKTGQGVKKTGAVIGKTFGKIGGVFHD